MTGAPAHIALQCSSRCAHGVGRWADVWAITERLAGARARYSWNMSWGHMLLRDAARVPD